MDAPVVVITLDELLVGLDEIVDAIPAETTCRKLVASLVGRFKVDLQTRAEAAAA